MIKDHFKNPEEEVYETVKKALELGINYFDTGEFYAEGESEINLGKAFKKIGIRREELVVATKIFLGKSFHDPGSINAKGLSRKKIIESVNACLKRL